MLTTTRAIVLRCLKYGDQKVIVDLFTELHGRISFAAKLSTSQRGKIKKQLFQPLTILQVSFDYRQHQQLQRISDIQLAVPWTDICLNPTKMSIGLFLAEVLYHTTRMEQQDRQLYQYIETSMMWLDATTEGVANFHIAFLIKLSKFLGWDILHAEESLQLTALQDISIENIHCYAMSRQARQTYLYIILDYYRHNMPSFPELRSLAVMQEIYD